MYRIVWSTNSDSKKRIELKRANLSWWNNWKRVLDGPRCRTGGSGICGRSAGAGLFLSRAGWAWRGWYRLDGTARQSHIDGGQMRPIITTCDLVIYVGRNSFRADRYWYQPAPLSVFFSLTFFSPCFFSFFFLSSFLSFMFLLSLSFLHSLLLFCSSVFFSFRVVFDR